MGADKLVRAEECAMDALDRPYRGLQPFDEGDDEYFFGRTREQKVIIASLYGSPLTILYGASGVGKTSLLRAGVVPELKRNHRVAVVVFRNWQTKNFLTVLRREILAATFAAVNTRLESNGKTKLKNIHQLLGAINNKLKREHLKRLEESKKVTQNGGLNSPLFEHSRLIGPGISDDTIEDATLFDQTSAQRNLSGAAPQTARVRPVYNGMRTGLWWSSFFYPRPV
jgi:hypothetical protein